MKKDRESFIDFVAAIREQLQHQMISESFNAAQKSSELKIIA